MPITLCITPYLIGIWASVFLKSSKGHNYAIIVARDITEFLAFHINELMFLASEGGSMQ